MAPFELCPLVLGLFNPFDIFTLNSIILGSFSLFISLELNPLVPSNLNALALGLLNPFHFMSQIPQLWNCRDQILLQAPGPHLLIQHPIH